MALGKFAEGIFAEGIFAEGIFAERNFRRREVLPNGTFVEQNFCGPNFCRTEISPKSSPNLSLQARREVDDNQQSEKHEQHLSIIGVHTSLKKLAVYSIAYP